MIKLKHFAYLLTLMIILISCKNDNPESPANKKEAMEKSKERKEKSKDIKEKSKEDIKGERKKPILEKRTTPINKNILSVKLIENENTSIFASSLTSSGLFNVFSGREKQFTVFAPSNDAYKTVPNNQLPLLFSDSELLSEMMKSHIVEGRYNYSELSAKIKSSGGEVKLKTMSGVNLKASLSGNTIIVKDNSGNVSSVLEEEIKADNGVIYIIDKVLTIK